MKFIQSGVIPYRKSKNGLELLLITNRSGKRWVIPKGLVEEDLSPLNSALKEAWEEAGIRGKGQEKSVGAFSYRKWGGVCEVEVFLMEVSSKEDDYPEAHFRRRKWFTPEDAADCVRERKLRRLLHKLPKLV